ncbi:MAG: GDP-L-fucose synthase family protein [Solirubrobacteraceae bacterium]
MRGGVTCPDRAFWRGRQTVVTGGAGFVGRSLVPQLVALGAAVSVVRSAEHDLRDADQTRAALDGADLVFHLAGVVGGIGFNRRHPARLAYDNMLMSANVFEQARLAKVRKLVCACTVCAYPKFTPTPFREEDLWNGYPEETNAPYGLAKKMMLVLSDAYRREHSFNSCVLMIVNLYGPGDSFDLEDSHVIPAMVRKFVDAQERGEHEVVLWGSGTASREFLHVRDAARGLILAAERLDSSEPVNLGTGEETTISELAETISRLTGYTGQIVWDSSQPDGQPSRRLDISRARALLGFDPGIRLEDGLRETVAAYRQGLDTFRGSALELGST